MIWAGNGYSGARPHVTSSVHVIGSLPEQEGDVYVHPSASEERVSMSISPPPFHVFQRRGAHSMRGAAQRVTEVAGSGSREYILFASRSFTSRPRRSREMRRVVVVFAVPKPTEFPAQHSVDVRDHYSGGQPIVRHDPGSNVAMYLR